VHGLIYEYSITIRLKRICLLLQLSFLSSLAVDSFKDISQVPFEEIKTDAVISQNYVHEHRDFDIKDVDLISRH
jgi:hypothetical protein